MSMRSLISFAVLLAFPLWPASAGDDSTATETPPEEVEEEEPQRFVEKMRLFEDDHQDSLIVFFDPDTVDRLSRALQLRIYDETAFDPEEKAFHTRPVALITGPGLNPGGLRFDPVDPEAALAFADILDRFLGEVQSVEKDLISLQQQEEPWMVGGRRALSGSREYGQFHFDFRRRISNLTATWDLDLNRFSLVADRQYIIDHRLVPGMVLFLRNLPGYLEKRGDLREQLARARERSGDFFSPLP